MVYISVVQVSDVPLIHHKARRRSIIDQVQILVVENDLWVKVLFPEYK